MLDFTSSITIFLIPLIFFGFLNANIQPTKAQYENKSKTGQQEHSQVWNMAKEFGKHHNVKDWVFHYDGAKNSKWKLLYQSIIKQKQNDGYFSTRIASTNGFLAKPKNKLSLNLYLHRDISLLNHLIAQEMGRNLRKGSREGIIRNKSSNIWMIQMPENCTKNDILLLFNETSLKYDSLTFAFIIGTDNIIDIYDVYRITMESQIILKEFGRWERTYGLIIPDPDIWSRRSSLNGHHLRVASAKNPPAVTHVQDNCSSSKCFRGLFADAWCGLSKEMNFTYTIQRASEWGSFVNGAWNGMIGMLEKDEVDIAVTDLIVTKDRSSVVNFLQSLMENKEKLYIKNPSDALSFGSYTMPFTPLAWKAIALSIIIVPLIVSLIAYLSLYEDCNNYGLKDCYSFVIEILLVSVNNVVTRNPSNKIAAVTMIFGGCVLYQFWEAHLEATLAIKRIDLPFKTMFELSQNSEFKLITSRGTIYVDQFRDSTKPLLSKIWNEKMKPYEEDFPFYENLDEAILADEYAVAYVDETMEQGRKYRDCKIVSLGGTVRTSQIAWAIQPDSTLDEAFHYHIRKLQEIGVIQRYTKVHTNKSPQLCSEHGGDPHSVKQCITAFLVFIGGICGCIVLLGIEIYISQLV